MPRYYFHLRVGRTTILDHNGLELPGVAHACKEAAHRYRQYAQCVALDPSEGAIILDDESQTVIELSFNDREGSDSTPAEGYTKPV